MGMTARQIIRLIDDAMDLGGEREVIGMEDGDGQDEERQRIAARRKELIDRAIAADATLKLHPGTF